MNPIFIVIPILTLMMFIIGLELRIKDFLYIKKEPLAVVIGLIGQLIILPIIGFSIAIFFDLSALLFLGLMLIVCSPGGSSSNAFSLLVKGDLALSVTLTALSSVITIITLPLYISWTLHFIHWNEMNHLEFPIIPMILQNVVLTIIPVCIGMTLQIVRPKVAKRWQLFLNKAIFPALLILVSLFFIEHRETIFNYFTTLGLPIALLIMIAMAIGKFGAQWLGLDLRQQRTIIIEIGMQNAAQAIALACSPIVFNNTLLAIPAIIYALFMNIILLFYVKTRGSIIQHNMIGQ